MEKSFTSLRVIRPHKRYCKPEATIAQGNRRNMITITWRIEVPGRTTKDSDFKGMSFNEIRPILWKRFEIFKQNIEAYGHGSEKMKSPKRLRRINIVRIIPAHHYLSPRSEMEDEK
ncbi:hypothetical protein Tco_0358929 [Tanacetum coccineum]